MYTYAHSFVAVVGCDGDGGIIVLVMVHTHFFFVSNSSSSSLVSGRACVCVCIKLCLYMDVIKSRQILPFGLNTKRHSIEIERNREEEKESFARS